MNEAQWEQVVAKLTAQTESGVVRWTARAQLANTIEGKVGPGYTTEVDGSRFRVYEYEWQTSTDGETFYPVREVSIEFAAENWDGLWPLPMTPSRWKLWNAIRYQAVDAQGFLDRFLKAS